MGTKDDPIDSSSSSSPTQPLLSSKPPLYPSLPSSINQSEQQTQIQEQSEQQTHDDDDDDIEEYPLITFNNNNPRQFHDIPFLLLFLLFLLSTFSFGIFSIFHHNINYSSNLSSSYSYDFNSSSCVPKPNTHFQFNPNLDKNPNFLLFQENSNVGLKEFDPNLDKNPNFLLFEENSNVGLKEFNPNLDKNPNFVPFESNSNVGLKEFDPNLDEKLNFVFFEENSNVGSHFLKDLIGKKLNFVFFGKNLNVGSHFLKDLIWVLIVTLILSGPFTLGLLWLLRHYTKQIVYISIPFFVVIPVFFNVYWFVACTVSSTCSDAFPMVYRVLALLFVFVVIGVIVWIIVANWHRIELTVRIVGVAADALARNLGLFVVIPCLTIGLLVYFVPIVVFLVYAPMNGKVVPKLRKGTESGYTCVWKQDAWVPAYYALAILTMLWSAAAMVEAQIFVISGTIAQWYFSKEDSTPRRSIRYSLRNAFGPSFGTVCFSGLLIAVVRIVRAAVDSARREDVLPGIVNLILRCCVNALLTAVDFLNKFTINFAAITGESYCSSAKMTYELLKRNLLSAVFVETVSTRVLAGIVFVLSAIYAIVVCAILKAVSDLEVEVYYVSVLAGLLLIVVLGFFVHVLDNVIETVYVCFAIDRDKGEVYKQEVHEVYVHLPITRNHRPSLATRTPPLVV